MINCKIIYDVLQEISKEIDGIQLGIFGSFARNEQTEDSDIDIIVKADYPILLICDGIEKRIVESVRKKIGISKIDVLDYADIEKDYEEAKKEGLEEFALKTIIDKETIWVEI